MEAIRAHGLADGPVAAPNEFRALARGTRRAFPSSEMEPPRDRDASALLLLRRIAGERDPHALAARAADFLVREFGAPLLGIAWQESSETCAAVATTLDAAATDAQLARFFAEGPPVRTTIVRAAAGVVPGASASLAARARCCPGSTCGVSHALDAPPRRA